MKKDPIILEAEGEFPFTFYIEKASVADDLENLDIEGIASTTNIDHDKERMSKEALYAMESTINKEGVPLRVEHQKEGTAIIGKVYKAWVDDRNQLHVRARLDKSHPVSSILHNSMKQGLKMGLSVGGIVKRAVREFSEAVGSTVKTFYDVALQEVSVTPRPANYDSWLVAKSIAKDTKEAENFSENEAMRQQFLFENSQLDYLQAFAKSVPDKAWHKVESPEVIKEIKQIMSKDTEKKEEEGMETETEKAVTRAEFNDLSKGLKSLVKAVANGFATMAKAMDVKPHDQNSPDKDKPEDESPTAKATKKKKAMDSDAMDQDSPDKKKPADESGTAKATKDDEEETEKADDDSEEEKEKSEADGTDENGEREKTSKKADQEDTYDIETVNRAIKSMNAVTKKLKKADEKKEEDETEKSDDMDEKETDKAAEDTEDMDEKKMKAIHPMDAFVVSVTKAMEAVVEKLEKKGQRVLGFEKEFIEKTIKNDPAMQAEILSLMKIPGFKKSVSMGVPYMATKDGKRIALINTPEKVQKSQEDEPKDFKTLYKQKYSSTSEEEVNE
jgi:phage head maturation protease